MTLTLLEKQQVPLPDLSNMLTVQKEFHDSFGIPKTKDMAELYVRLIEEEHEEWIEEYYAVDAVEADELKELTDLLYVTAGLAYQLGFTIDKLEPYNRKERYDDGITDLVSLISIDNATQEIVNNLIYCLFGYASYMEWDLEEAYNRVHKSNMSKLGDDGKPIRREDGKVLKGPNYMPPNLKDLTNDN